MSASASSATISLGSVVLDRPDRTGRFIAKDLAGGWAYLVADGDGDSRFRGQGVCQGGLDVALRCGFLLAAGYVPDYQKLRISVETRQAHQAMVRLATADPHVIEAIAGRPVTIMTRPLDRSSFQARAAAERAASGALLVRERAEMHQLAEPEPMRALVAPVVTALPTDEAAKGLMGWRTRTGSAALGLDPADSKRTRPETPAASAAIRPVTSRSSALSGWLQDFDKHAASVTKGIEEVGR